jgi:hypothetical protein
MPVHAIAFRVRLDVAVIATAVWFAKSMQSHSFTVRKN